MSFVFWMFVISIGINLLMFIPAFIYKTDKLTDISYGVTFIVVSFVGYIWSPKTIAQQVVLILVFLWAIRLGTFLFIRINKMKKDARFDGMRERFFIFLRFWLLQGITVFIILIPSILLWGQSNTKITWLAASGVAIFGLGFLIESIADIQKYRFNNNAKRKTWIDVGIWRTSRHPNYLGEILVWIGIYIFVAPSLIFVQQLIALIGPLYITVLLLFVSGIPLLEKSGNKKWGDEKTYQKYKSEVPVLIPSVTSIRRIIK